MLEFHNCNLINYPNVWKETSYFQVPGQKLNPTVM